MVVSIARSDVPEVLITNLLFSFQLSCFLSIRTGTALPLLRHCSAGT